MMALCFVIKLQILIDQKMKYSNKVFGRYDNL
jgi:hypothetical protein